MTRHSQFFQPLRLVSVALSLCVAFASTLALAEPADTTSSQEAPGLSLAVTPVYQFDSSLNSGGSVSVFHLL